MKQKYLKLSGLALSLLMLLLLSDLFVFASPVRAEGAANYSSGQAYQNSANSGSQVPASNATYSTSTGIIQCGDASTPCTLCHLIIGVKRLIDWGTKILVTMAIVAIIISGIIYIISSGSSGLMTSAKTGLTYAISGFAIFICAWLIVNTVMWLLSAKADLGVGAVNWYTFNCSTQSNALTGATSTNPNNQNATPKTAEQMKKECDDYCNNGGDVDLGTDIPTCKSTCIEAKTKEQTENKPASTGNTMSQSDAKNSLDNCGVRYANANTLNGIQDVSVNEMCNFKSASGCDTQITSGTTGSHATGSTCTHSNGCKFDFTPTSCNDAYIRNNYPNTGTRSDGAACYSAPDGSCYAREGNHWDMSTTRSCKAQGC